MQEWAYDETVQTVDDPNSWNRGYMWVVPAKVEGKWSLSTGGELVIRQEFQKIKGSISWRGNGIAIENGLLLGNKIRFSADGADFTGIVEGKRIEGTRRSEENLTKWTAKME